MRKKYGVLVLVIAISIASLYIFNFINDNQKKYLDEVVSFEVEKFKSLEVNFYWKTDKKKDAQDLKELLSKYRVKKINSQETNDDISEKEGFAIVIYSDEGTIIATIYEDQVNFVNDGHSYEVLNGPIDMNWFHNFSSNHSNN